MIIKPLDPILYKRVKDAADRKFSVKTSAYKSSWLVAEYKRRGGKYSGKPRSSGVKKGISKIKKKKKLALKLLLKLILEKGQKQ